MFRTIRTARDRYDLRARRYRGDTGQILVIVAGGLIGLLAIAALALEGGTVVLNRRDGQNAADLAALAGTRVVALRYTAPTGDWNHQSKVFEAVQGSMDLNNCGASSSAPCTWSAEFVGGSLTSLGPVTNVSSPLPNGTVGVNVNVTRSPGAMMGRVLGFDHWDVSTEATAATGSSPQSPGGILLPIALCGFGPDNAECQQATGTNAKPFNALEAIVLTDGKVGPGNFGWLSWDGKDDAQTLKDSLCTPNNPAFTLDGLLDAVGDWKHKDATGTNPADGETWFPGGNGKMNSSGVRDCLNQWIASGTTVLVPIYDVTSDKVGGNNNGANNLAYHIVGVAAVVLTAIDQPAVDQIQARFVDYYPLTDIPSGAIITPPNADTITTFLGLVQ